MVDIKGIPLRKFIPAIIWFIIVLVLICLPKEEMPDTEGWWEWLKKIYLDKWIHVGIFAIMAFLFMLPVVKAPLTYKFKWQFMVYITLAVSAWGFITELIQLLVPGRSFDLIDWLADSFGAFIALIFCRRFFLKQQANNF